MLGASKLAYQSLIKLVDSNKNLHTFENGESVLLLADAISGNKTLLTTLTDSGISPEARAGVAKDAGRGLALGMQSAASGSCFGQFVVGDYFDKCLQDDAEAVRWYLLAASQGHAAAQFNLG